MRIGHQTLFRGPARAARPTHERRPRRQTRRRFPRGAPDAARAVRPCHQGVRGRAAPEPEDAPGHLSEEQERRLAPLHESVSMDTDTFMAIPAPVPRTTFEPPDFEEREGRLGLSTAFFSAATAASRVAGLVREIVAASYFGISGADVRVHDRLPDPEPGPQPVRGRGDPGGLRPGLPREARAGGPPRGVPARLAADLPGGDGARGAHRRLRAGGARAGPDLRSGLRGRAAGPDGDAVADPVPDPDPARDHGDDRRHPQQRRPLRGLRDLAVLLERGDHRRAGGAGADLLRGGPDLRLRDRGPGRHRDPARDPRLGPAPHQVRRARALPDDLALRRATSAPT